jgi:hypothetical protein
LGAGDQGHRRNRHDGLENAGIGEGWQAGHCPALNRSVRQPATGGIQAEDGGIASEGVGEPFTSPFVLL